MPKRICQYCKEDMNITNIKQIETWVRNGRMHPTCREKFYRSKSKSVRPKKPKKIWHTTCEYCGTDFTADTSRKTCNDDCKKRLINHKRALKKEEKKRMEKNG